MVYVRCTIRTVQYVLFHSLFNYYYFFFPCTYGVPYVQYILFHSLHTVYPTSRRRVPYKCYFSFIVQFFYFWCTYGVLYVQHVLFHSFFNFYLFFIFGVHTVIFQIFLLLVYVRRTVRKVQDVFFHSFVNFFYFFSIKFL